MGGSNSIDLKGTQPIYKPICNAQKADRVGPELQVMSGDRIN